MNQQVIDISNEIGDFSRLIDVVTADLSALDSGKIPADWHESRVTGRLEFGPSAAGNDAVELNLSLAATVPATCQRCLRPFAMPLATRLALLLTGPGGEPDAQPGFEIWELDEDVVSPLEIADEALVMAMPLAAMHEDNEDCVAVAATAVADKTTTPFANLREQMDKGT